MWRAYFGFDISLNNSISLLILSIVLLVFLTLLLRIWRCVLQRIFHSFNCLNCLKLSLTLFGTTFSLRHPGLQCLPALQGSHRPNSQTNPGNSSQTQGKIWKRTPMGAVTIQSTAPHR